MVKRVASIATVLAMMSVAFLLPHFIPQFQLVAGSKPLTLVQTVKAKDLTLVCPGSVLQSAGGGKVDNFGRQGSAAIDYASNLPNGVSLKQLSLTGASARAASLPDTSGTLGNLSTSAAVAFTVADPNGLSNQNSTLLSAQNYQLEATATIYGALGANCQRPASQHWFVGASTATGRESLLILANPNPTDATVDLKLYGANGAIDGSGLAGIAVAANRTVVLPLAGFAPDNNVLAVNVESQGASVASWIQQKTVRGTVAGGADLISPALDAAKELVIPGLLKRGTQAASSLIAQNGDYSDLTPSIAVFAPGPLQANLTVQVIGSDSKTFGTVIQQSLAGGDAMTLPITGLKDGDYSVFVLSDQPVIAAVQLSRTQNSSIVQIPAAKPVGTSLPATGSKSSATDFAWLQAIQPSLEARSLVVPSTGVSKLNLATTSLRGARVTIWGLGAKQVLTIAKQTSRSILLTPGTVVSFSSDAPVSATMIVDFNSMIVAIPAINAGNQGGKIRISVR